MTSLQACIPTIAWHSRSEWRNSVIQMIKSSEGSKEKKKRWRTHSYVSSIVHKIYKNGDARMRSLHCSRNIIFLDLFLRFLYVILRAQLLLRCQYQRKKAKSSPDIILHLNSIINRLLRLVLI